MIPFRVVFGDPEKFRVTVYPDMHVVVEAPADKPSEVLIGFGRFPDACEDSHAAGFN